MGCADLAILAERVLRHFGASAVDCNDDEKPHAERIVEGFWLGQTEVTHAGWVKVNGGEPPGWFRRPNSKLDDQLPVEGVDWYQAADYCSKVGGRLPTEKEWEYAARAGTKGPRYGPPDEVEWNNENSDGTTHPVASKKANAFGLYDMLGNVQEWTASDDPDHHNYGYKVVRGGSYEGVWRVSERILMGEGTRDSALGFRCIIAAPTLSVPVSTGPVFSEIHDAVQSGDTHRVKALIEAHPDVVFSTDAKGNTALHYAAQDGRKDIASLLLANKADPNARNTNGETPIHAAVVGDGECKEVLMLLLAHGGDLDAADHSGNTPLHWARGAAMGGAACKGILLGGQWAFTRP